MLGIFSRPFNSLDEDDLRDLVEVRKVREHLHLDYKRDPYDHGHSGSVEMLADVTAMANAQGGYIVIGVEEDELEPDGTPKDIVGIDYGDQEATWMQSVCLSSIDEKIPGLRVRDILLSDGRSCVIVQIPNSVRKPHMVVHRKHRSFRVRHSRSKALMGMQEVRNMVISMSQYHEALDRFLEERRQEYTDFAPDQPWLLLMATPVYVDREKIDPTRSDIRELLRNVPGRPDNRYSTTLFAGDAEPRHFGVEALYPKIRRPKPPEKILRLFRTGHLEFWQDYQDLAPVTASRSARMIPSGRVAATILHFLRVVGQIMRLGQIYEPVSITFRLENIASSYLKWGRYVPHNVFIMTEADLERRITVNDFSAPEDIACRVVNWLFNAFGSDENPHFDEAGQFIRAN